jgi:predicted tellurium resistance membrane protein TerC
MGDKLWAHFDKLLLAVLFVIGVTVLVHIVHHGGVDVSLVQSVITWVGQILAALLTLMVGQRWMQRKADNGNGKGGDPPPSVT